MQNSQEVVAPTRNAQLMQPIRELGEQPSADTPMEPKESPGSSKVKKLLRYAGRLVELFQTPDRDAFATVQYEDLESSPRTHRRGPMNYPIMGHDVAMALTYDYNRREGIPPGTTAVKDVQAVLEAQALAEGPTEPLYVRVGGIGDHIYIDLCNDRSEVVDVTAGGWKVVTHPPVKFYRPDGMRPLPTPESGGKLHEDLLPLLNVETVEDFMLIVVWLVAALRQTGPYPALIINGEQGSAKSLMTEMLRTLIDPNKSLLRGIPKDESDVPLGARNNWIVTLDNVSHISDSLSDKLCRIATGGSFVKRQLYTVFEEASFTVQRPIIINGIEDVGTRGDLIDRAIITTLKQIPKVERRTEDDIRRKFEAVHARILGSLLDGVVMALRRKGEVKLDELPRMADFAKWGAAAESALTFKEFTDVRGKKFKWETGDFLKAYLERHEAANSIVLESVPWLAVLKDLLNFGGIPNKGEWEGSATRLHEELTTRALAASRLNTWPRTPKVLSGALRRSAPHLRSLGIDVVQQRTKSGSLIKIHVIPLEVQAEAGRATTEPLFPAD